MPQKGTAKSQANTKGPHVNYQLPLLVPPFEPLYTLIFWDAPELFKLEVKECIMIHSINTLSTLILISTRPAH